MFHARHSFSAIAISSVLLIAACTSETKTPQPAQLPAVDAQAAVDPGPNGAEGPATEGTATQVSTQEAIQFARDWEQAVRTGDAANGAGMIDFDTMIKRTLAPFNLDDEFRRGFEAGMKKSPPIERMIAQLGQNERGGGSYRMVNVARRGGQQHAVFRLLGADGSLNYHDLRIMRNDGILRADQFFVALSGEDLADTLRATITPAINAHQSRLARISGEEKRKFDELMKQQELMTAARSGDHEKAIRIYGQLSPDAQQIKSVQLGRLMAAMSLDPDEYIKVIDEYAQRFPDDPSLPLIMVDAAVMREDVDQLEQARAGLQKWTGGDPFLDLMIAGVLANFGHVARAQELVAEIDVDAVGIADAHDYALNVALRAKDHPAALAHLRKLRDEYEFQFSDLREAEGFEEFVKSPSFEAWREETEG